MKISYISRSDTWNDQQIMAEAKERKIDFAKVSIKDLNSPEIYKSLGDVILWRSSLLEPRSGRTTLLNILDKKGKFIINRSIIDYPAVIFKQFQQEYVKESTSNIKTIPTFTFLDKNALKQTVTEDILKFPFIKKPNLGAKGEGIKLIKSIEDLDSLKEEEVVKSVFQNFIKNDGDYRILVIGGRPLDAIKRTGEEGSFLNNVSMGGKALAVKDGAIKTELFKIATQIVATFNLGFCGVDVIQDKISGELYFLELNTVPQWEGFQKATGINVAQKILDYCEEVSDRDSSPTNILVKNCYTKYSEKLANKKLHFFTRMFLWTKDDKYLEQLEGLKEKYYGKGGDDFEKITKRILNEKDVYQKRIYNKKDFRVESADKHPLLGAYSELLFRNLMSKNVFEEDLRPAIEKFVSTEKLLEIKDKLLNNEEDTLALSTFAINYFYFLEEYFDGKKGTKVNVKKLLKIAQGDNFGDKKKDAKLIMNDIYFSTHIIIGASRFYKYKITKNKKTYLKLLRVLDVIVEENYIKLSLDTKLELLICARLLEVESSLEDRINQEAELSLSPINNFLVDTLNAKKGKSSKNWLGSEHRNVLYIMLNSAPS
jgi:RimK family alpha-L-glutamate ligase